MKGLDQFILRFPVEFKQLTLRLDPDVVDYFKHLGKGVSKHDEQRPT